MVKNIWTGMTATAKRHMKAICEGYVTKSNVIGLRKVFNHQARLDRYRSGDRINVKPQEVDDLMSALERLQPKVVGELHDSGVKLLQSKRYRSRFTDAQRAIIADIDCFRLVGYLEVGNLWHHVPAYRVIGKNGDKFTFYNVPWQSGGNGPEIVY